MDSHLEELKRTVEAAAEGMSSEQLNWHPTDKWCAAEVLEHLYLTYSGTIKGFSRVVEGGKPLAAGASLKHRLRTIVVVGFGHMPEGRQAPATTRSSAIPMSRDLSTRPDGRRPPARTILKPNVSMSRPPPPGTPWR